MSQKRYYSGLLTAKDIIALIEKYEPEQIVLARFLSSDITVRVYIFFHYSKIYDGKSAILLLRR